MGCLSLLLLLLLRFHAAALALRYATAQLPTALLRCSLCAAARLFLSYCFPYRVSQRVAYAARRATRRFRKKEIARSKQTARKRKR